MNEKNIKVKNVISECGADRLLPPALMYIFYIILHGHLSPGGGFQGGVLSVAVVVLLYLGHGYETTANAISLGFMHKFEGFASIVYVALAMLGVAYGANFCMNVFAHAGGIGDLVSSGTIAMMNVTVGVKVFAGVAVVALTMLGLIAMDREKE